MSTWHIIEGANYVALRSKKTRKPVILFNKRYLSSFDTEYASGLFAALYWEDYEKHHKGEEDILRADWPTFNVTIDQSLENDGPYLALNKIGNYGIAKCDSYDKSGSDLEICTYKDAKRYWVSVYIINDPWRPGPLFLINTREMSDEAADKMIDWAVDIVKKIIIFEGKTILRVGISEGGRRK